VAKRLQIRRDTDLNWRNNNPILSLGEPGYSTDTKILKIGDGQTVWNMLDYFIPQNTDDVIEGSENLYFSESRALSSALSTIQSASAYSVEKAQEYSDSLTTDNISEESNLYFTQERALSANESVILSASAAAVSSANSYTDSEISLIIDSAPSALNTLNEIAQSINDDANFYTTISNILDQKLEIASASSTYLSIINAESEYEPLGLASLAQSAATGYTDSAINALDTDDIEEGSNNLYYTDLKSVSAVTPTIESASANFIEYVDNITTSEVSEGTNLYFTNERAIESVAPLVNSASSNIISEYTSYINNEIGSLIENAPEELNTLGKISLAINNDNLYNETINNLLNEKINISSASSQYLSISNAENFYLTINSASSLYVTQDSFENAVQLAAESSSPSYIDINFQSSSYTVEIYDLGRTIEIFSSASTILAIPDNPSMPVGFYFNLTQTGDGPIEIMGDPGVVIYSENNNNSLYSKYSSAYIYKKSLSEWIVIKNNGKIMLKSEGGTLYSISVDNDGSLTTSQV
jgi:hypothetical protein